MIKKNIFILFLFLFPFFSFAENTGFVESSIWFSEEKFEEGDSIKIYTGIWNGENQKLSGTANFYDKNLLIGKKDFEVNAQELKSIFIDWKVAVGDRNFSVNISDARFLDGTPLDISKTKTEEVSVTVKKKIDNTASLIGAVDSIENSSFGKKLGDNLDKAEGFVVENIPSDVMNVLANTFSPVEDFRQNRSSGIDKKINEVKLNIEMFEKDENDKVLSESSESSNGENILFEDVDKIKSKENKPVQYVYYFFLKLLKFIYNNSIIFYGLIAYILFVIIRFFIRRFRSE